MRKLQVNPGKSVQFQIFAWAIFYNIEVENQMDNQKPLDLFKLFLSNEVLDFIVEESNRFANQCNKNLQINRAELESFFGILIAMGLVSLPAIHVYWAKDTLFNNAYISSVMPRDRFITIMKYIHFCNTETADKQNRLYKVDNLIKKIHDNFRKPGKKLKIDESMIPWRGRLLYRQYIPNKTHPYGIKIYKLCTPEGYAYNFDVYTGKQLIRNPNLSHSEDTVLKLLDCLPEKEGYHLYADNFYSSVHLARVLYDMKMIYCGTLRSNRKGIPPQFKTKLRRGEILGLQNNNVM